MRFGVIILGLILLGGCSSYFVVDGVSVIGTDKTFEDHFISLTSGKNCSTVRREKGQSYCEEDEITRLPNVHCYRTLGKITCYDKPDPYRNGQNKVGENDHNYLKNP